MSDDRINRNIKKYVLYKLRNVSQHEKELKSLQALRKKMRIDVYEEGFSPNMDGQPHAKGNISDSTYQKTIRLLEIDRRIEKLSTELEIIKETEQTIKNMGERAEKIYYQTLKGEHHFNFEMKAHELHMGNRQFIMARARILELFATRLGEYFDDKELQ